jgi:hypothetical protein
VIRLVALVLLLSTGCALVTRPSDQISVERQKFINAYARVRVLYSALADGVARECESGRRTREDCAAKAAIHHEAKQLDAEIQAKIDTPESEVDWDRVMKVLELGLSLVL